MLLLFLPFFKIAMPPPLLLLLLRLQQRSSYWHLSHQWWVQLFEQCIVEAWVKCSLLCNKNLFFVWNDPPKSLCDDIEASASSVWKMNLGFLHHHHHWSLLLPLTISKRQWMKKQWSPMEVAKMIQRPYLVWSHRTCYTSCPKKLPSWPKWFTRLIPKMTTWRSTLRPWKPPTKTSYSSN